MMTAAGTVPAAQAGTDFFVPARGPLRKTQETPAQWRPARRAPVGHRRGVRRRDARARAAAQPAPAWGCGGTLAVRTLAGHLSLTTPRALDHPHTLTPCLATLCWPPPTRPLAVPPRAQFSPPTSSVAALAPPCPPHAIRYGSAPFERTRDRPRPPTWCPAMPCTVVHVVCMMPCRKKIYACIMGDLVDFYCLLVYSSTKSIQVFCAVISLSFLHFSWQEIQKDAKHIYDIPLYNFPLWNDHLKN